MCIAVVALHLRVVQQLFDGEILEVQVVLHSSRRVLEACAKAAVLMSWLAFHDSTNPSAQPRGSLPKKVVGYLLLMRIMKDSGPGFGRKFSRRKASNDEGIRRKPPGASRFSATELVDQENA